MSEDEKHPLAELADALGVFIGNMSRNTFESSRGRSEGQLSFVSKRPSPIEPSGEEARACFRGVGLERHLIARRTRLARVIGVAAAMFV